MDYSDKSRRRQFLAACAAVGLAGCTDGDEAGGSQTGTTSARTAAGTTGVTGTTTGSGSYNAPAWFTDRGDLQHTASVNGSLSVPLSERWRVSLGDQIESSPVGGHGAILVGTNDGTLHARSPTDGSKQWSYDAGNAVTTAPTAKAFNKGTDKFVWVATRDGTVHAVDADSSSQLWTSSAGAGTFNSGVNYATGLVFQQYMDSGVSTKLRALDAQSGTIQWEFGVGNVSTPTPMHGFGRVHVGEQQGGTVFETVEDATGSKVWDIRNTNSNAGSATSGTIHSDVDENESALVITSTENGYVGGYEVSTGTEAWRTDLSEFGIVVGVALTQGRRQNSPTQNSATQSGTERNTLVVAQRGGMYGLDPNTGSVQWTYTHARNPQNSSTRRTAQPAIYGDHVFQIVGGSELVAVSLANGTREWGTSIGGPTHSSPLVGGDTVYVGDGNGDLIAFSP